MGECAIPVGRSELVVAVAPIVWNEDNDRDGDSDDNDDADEQDDDDNDSDSDGGTENSLLLEAA
jgi:hypothetical protein